MPHTHYNLLMNPSTQIRVNSVYRANNVYVFHLNSGLGEFDEVNLQILVKLPVHINFSEKKFFFIWNFQEISELFE